MEKTCDELYKEYRVLKEKINENKATSEEIIKKRELGRKILDRCKDFVKEIGENEKLEVGPSLRLVGMTWIPMAIIYFLPSSVWAIIVKVALVLFVIIVIRGAFSRFWERYETMGAFVAMQAAWFAGILWVPDSFYLLKFIFGLLIVLGMATHFKQIKHINEGFGPDLRHHI